MSSNNTSDEVFLYTGSETIPKDVAIVNFHCSVVGVEAQTFRECTKLKEIVLNSEFQLQTIGRCAFNECTSLERINISSMITKINNHTFKECTQLREVVLNEGLQKIEWYAFAGCHSLQSITIPSTVTDIDEGAFYRCSGLKNVILNEGLKKIADGAFISCKLETIKLPSSLAVIGNAVFMSCTKLREVVCNGLLPKIGHNTFDACSALERITFPNISTRLEDIIQAGQVDAQNKIQQFMNQSEIEWERGGMIYIPVEVTGRSRDGWGIVQQHVHQIVSWIKYYEMKEVTTLFELAFWKAKIDQVEDDVYERDRDACRVEVPGPVKDTILQYLDLKVHLKSML